MSTIEPGGGTGADPYTHDSDEEVVVVLEGVLDLWVGDEHYVLREGDAITYPSRVPHWNVNHGSGPAPRPVLHHAAELLSAGDPGSAFVARQGRFWGRQKYFCARQRCLGLRQRCLGAPGGTFGRAQGVAPVR